MDQFDVFGMHEMEAGEEKQKYEASHSHKMQTTEVDECGNISGLAPGDKMSELAKKLGYITADPLDKFKQYVGAISHSLTEDGVLDISKEERNSMCKLANSLEGVKYLNPTAYILGYYVTRGGRKIDIQLVRQIFQKVLPNLPEDAGIERPDVIRYARFLVQRSG